MILTPQRSAYFDQKYTAWTFDIGKILPRTMQTPQRRKVVLQINPQGSLHFYSLFVFPFNSITKKINLGPLFFYHYK